MKRFYKDVVVRPLDGGATLLLDDKPLRTPAKRPLAVPSVALAEALATEWRAQGETVKPQTMPLTQLCCTTLDLTLYQEEELFAEITAYGASDLLCYRAEQPPKLAERQDRVWQPLLDWVAEAHGAPLRTTKGLTVVSQPPDSLAALARAVAAHRGFRLTALSQLVRSTGSLVIGLAVSSGRLGVEEAFTAAELDTLFQMEFWGEDEEALDRQGRVRGDLDAAVRLLALTRVH